MYWAELVTPEAMLTRMMPGPNLNQRGMHPRVLLDLAVLRIRGPLEMTDPTYRGVKADYFVKAKHAAESDQPLPEGLRFGDPEALEVQKDTLTAFGWASPRNEITIFSDSATLQRKANQVLVSQCILHDGSAGGPAVDHYGRIVGVNSKSHTPTHCPHEHVELGQPPQTVEYTTIAEHRMVSALEPDHGLVGDVNVGDRSVGVQLR